MIYGIVHLQNLTILVLTFTVVKVSIDSSIKSTQKLKEVYLKKLLEDKTKSLEMIGGSPVLVKDNVSETKEFEALQLEIKLKKELSDFGDSGISKGNKYFEYWNHCSVTGCE